MIPRGSSLGLWSAATEFHEDRALALGLEPRPTSCAKSRGLGPGRRPGATASAGGAT